MVFLNMLGKVITVNIKAEKGFRKQSLYPDLYSATGHL